MDHVDHHKILKFFQHGFRAKRSCETQLINTIEDLANGLDHQQQLDLPILDFSKAFDLVGHQRLLHKLHYYGIRNTTLTWISGWLTSRTQKVVVDGESSGEARVICGVRQGTVLGLLMFILYINDIDNETSSSIRLFADDSLLYRTASCTRDASELQRDLKQICRWADLWQMNFNVTKCHVLSVTKKTQPLMFPYTIGGQQLQHVTHHPTLALSSQITLAGDPTLTRWSPRPSAPWTCSAGTLVTAPRTPKTSHIRLLCVLCKNMLVLHGILTRPTIFTEWRMCSVGQPVLWLVSTSDTSASLLSCKTNNGDCCRNIA